MSTIPASAIVNVTPNVLSAGGSALDLIGLLLSNSSRIPIGSVVPFATAQDVADYFGDNAVEATLAQKYFAGFDGSTVKPGSILFAQYNQQDVAAFLRGGDFSSVSIEEMQELGGSLSINFDGYVRTANSIDLSSANSYSAAAALIQTGLNTSLPTEAAGTGSFGATFTGTGTGTSLQVTAVTGVIHAGDLLQGDGVPDGTTIVSQSSGDPGGAGIYLTSNATTSSSDALSTDSPYLDMSAVDSGTVAPGQTVTGSGISDTQIIGGPGTGLVGSYLTNKTQNIASEAITMTATAVTVVFDSVTGAFVITSGATGTPSSAAFATGSLAIPLKLTSATGAVISQGAVAADPSSFMNTIIDITQNWATFMLCFNPDQEGENDVRFAFAEWNGDQNNRYAFICSDDDEAAATVVPASASLGQRIIGAGISGTTVIFEPANEIAAFICGSIASVNFTQANGRADMAFRSQSGLVPTADSLTEANNLKANGYNWYGAYATANEQFVWFQNGSISGKFLWLDSYVNEIQLNAAFQLALMTLLQQSFSIPYNDQGSAMIENALQGTINNALSFGSIRAGVPLSPVQRAEVNSAAGVDIASTIEQRGWYLQVLAAQTPPNVRAARGSPACNFWYTDGQSVQQINLNSIEIQ